MGVDAEASKSRGSFRVRPTTRYNLAPARTRGPDAGRVPEWTKGTDCKSVCVSSRGFESHRGLSFLQRIPQTKPRKARPLFPTGPYLSCSGCATHGPAIVHALWLKHCRTQTRCSQDRPKPAKSSLAGKRPLRPDRHPSTPVAKRWIGGRRHFRPLDSVSMQSPSPKARRLFFKQPTTPLPEIGLPGRQIRLIIYLFLSPAS